MNQQITAVIITKNEEKNIERCLTSLQDVVDEIIVMDSNSSDNTVELARRLNANVFSIEWKGYAETKNLGHSKSRNNYILSLDADEVLSESLASQITALKKIGFSGTYSMNRKTNYCGSWINHSGWYPDSKIRIFDKTKVKWEGEFVHESLSIPSDTSNTHLKSDILHYSYTDKKDHRARADKYSSLTAQKLFSEGKPSNLLRPFLSAIGRFVKMYVFKLGFLDGLAGFTIARISAQSNSFKYQELNRLHRKAKIQAGLKHLCISRIDSIGDVMLTLPLAGLLKQEFPSLKITFLGRNYTKALIDSCSFIDEFISYDDFSETSLQEQTQKIMSHHFDAVIHVLPSKKLAALFKRSRVKLRIGTARRLYNLTRCNRFVNYSRRKSDLHESQLNLKLIEALHCNAQISLSEIFSYYGFSARTISGLETYNSQHKKTRIILHPKSQGSAPEWSLSNFKELANSLAESGVHVFITGTEKEGQLVRPHFHFSEDIIDVTGKFSLTEFISFILTCDGLVAASTGPLHVAAALDIHTLGLYTTERPMYAGRWQPVGRHVHVISAETENNLLDISPEAVKCQLLDLFV